MCAYLVSSTPVFSSVNQVFGVYTMKISRKKEGQKEEKATTILQGDSDLDVKFNKLLDLRIFEKFIGPPDGGQTLNADCIDIGI